VDGRWVNIIDSVGIQADGESWLFEAEWDANGARCFTESTRARNVSCAIPRPMASCGSSLNFGQGTLLMSEIEPQP
jgi:hypothetical protein